MTTQGFITIGRTELLLTLIGVALMMAILGYALGQVIMMIRRPAIVKPEPCTRLHCEDARELNAWLSRCDYSLITNERLSQMDTEYIKARNRPTVFKTGPQHEPGWPTAEQVDALIAKLDAATSRHRKADS